MRIQQIVLRIPKDPTSTSITFLTGLPEILKDRIQYEEWVSYVDGLNDIILKKEANSFWTPVKVLLSLDSFIIKMKTSYNEEVEKYLGSVNDNLKPKGIYIENPCLNGLIELVIIVNKEAE